MHDVVIRNGTIIDGSGAPRFRGDVAIDRQRISEVGRVASRGRSEIDAEGMVVAPGFIDAHTHFDAQIFWDSHGTSPAFHGVTTAIMGNCGFGLAPGRPDQADMVIRSLERAEDIPRSAITAGVNWSWETFAQFLDAIDGIPKGINFGAYVGHSALRAYVMGERAFTDAATELDLRRMEVELEAALGAGALGLSTSRSSHHRTMQDKPVASRMADWSEIEALVWVMARRGAGIFQLAPEHPDDREGQLDFRRRLRELAVRSGRTVSFGVHRDFVWLDALDDIAAAGGHVAGQVSAMGTTSAVLSFMTVLPFNGLPSWARLRALPPRGKLAQLKDPTARSRLVNEAVKGPYRNTVGAEIGAPRFDEMFLFGASDRSSKPIAVLAADRDMSPVELMIDLAVESDLSQLFVQPMYSTPDQVVLAGITHPHTVVAGSDAGAHVDQIIDSSMPTRLLSHFVRETELLTWEEGVRLLSRDPAVVWGFWDRGLVQVGCAADLVLFRPDRVGPGEVSVVNDLPDGSPRLMQRADGVEATFVNGEPYTLGGELTDALNGQLLRAKAPGS